MKLNVKGNVSEFTDSLKNILTSPVKEVISTLESLGKFERFPCDMLDLSISIDDQLENSIAHNIKFRIIENAEAHYIGYQRIIIADQVLAEAESTLKYKLEMLTKDTRDIGSFKYGMSDADFTGGEASLIGKRTKSYQKLYRTYDHLCHQTKLVSESAIYLKQKFSDHV